MAKPEKRFRCGGIDAAIFVNEFDQGGNAVKIKKVSFQKRYKTAEDEWKSTNSLDVNDIPKAILALTKAYEYLVLKDDTKESENWM